MSSIFVNPSVSNDDQNAQINARMLLLNVMLNPYCFVTDGRGEWWLGQICGLSQQWRCDSY
jgi:hypothetical protein